MDQTKNIANYYESTYLDYFWVLNTPKHHNFHYGYFDKKNRTIPRAISNLNKKVSEFANIKDSQHILDSGCGIGGSSIWLSKNFDVQVTGITVVDSQIEKARLLAEKNSIQNRTSFKNRNFLNTEFKDDTFDVVWAIESMSHAVDKAQFVNEAYRVLKPGGTLVVSDGFLGNVSSAKKFNQYKTMLNGWVVPNLVSSNEFVGYLNKAGFETTESKNISKKVMPFSRRLYYYAKFGLPISKLLQIMKIRNQIQTENVQTALYQYPALRDDVWRYEMIKAVK